MQGNCIIKSSKNEALFSIYKYAENQQINLVDKENYAWHLCIKIQIGNLLYNEEKQLQQKIEIKLLKLVASHCPIKPVLKLIYNDKKILHWYIACPNINYSKSKKTIDAIKKLRYLYFEINKDPKWSRVAKYISS